jgi:hypothetical protein
MPAKSVTVDFDFGGVATAKGLAAPIDPADALRLQDVPGLTSGISGGVVGDQNLVYFRVTIGLNYQTTTVPNNNIESLYTDTVFTVTYDGSAY